MTGLLLGGAALLGVLAGTGYLWATRHPTFEAVQRGALALEAEQRDAVASLLQDAGVEAHAVLVVQNQEECWHHRWSWLEHQLRVYRLYGGYNAHCVGIEAGQVTSLSLGGTRLATAESLARLPALRTVRLRDNRLATLRDVPNPCQWTHLDLAGNEFTDLDALSACPALEVLNVARNALTHWPPLAALPRLTHLDLSSNALTDLHGLQGHPTLHDLSLAHNEVATLWGLDGLPDLERLDLSGNHLTALDGEGRLPGLKWLRIGSNRLEALPADWHTRWPSLEWVDANYNPLRALPEGFEPRTASRRATSQAEPIGGGWPVLNVAHTPAAERMAQAAYAVHDPAQLHEVASLPRAHGRWHKARTRSRTRTGFSSGLYEQGRADWLRGVGTRAFETDRALSVTVTASVESGRLRVYLRSATGGYAYAEALPGKPLRIVGTPVTGTSAYVVYFEAVSERAEGIAWTITS